MTLGVNMAKARFMFAPILYRLAGLSTGFGDFFLHGEGSHFYRRRMEKASEMLAQLSERKREACGQKEWRAPGGTGEFGAESEVED